MSPMLPSRSEVRVALAHTLAHVRHSGFRCELKSVANGRAIARSKRSRGVKRWSGAEQPTSKLVVRDCLPDGVFSYLEKKPMGLVFCK